MSSRKKSVFYKVVKENIRENGESETILVGPLSGSVRKGRGRDVMVYTSTDGTTAEFKLGSIVKLSKPITNLTTTSNQ